LAPMRDRALTVANYDSKVISVEYAWSIRALTTVPNLFYGTGNLAEVSRYIA
jgi:hypothetical protein